MFKFLTVFAVIGSMVMADFAMAKGHSGAGRANAANAAAHANRNIGHAARVAVPAKINNGRSFQVQRQGARRNFNLQIQRNGINRQRNVNINRNFNNGFNRSRVFVTPGFGFGFNNFNTFGFNTFRTSVFSPSVVAFDTFGNPVIVDGLGRRVVLRRNRTAFVVGFGTVAVDALGRVRVIR